MAIRINYNSLTAGIVNFLSANSATVNSGMAVNLSSIHAVRADRYLINESQFPAITVDLRSHAEEPDDFSHRRKKITSTFEIGCHVKHLESLSICTSLLRDLVANVEVAIRGDVTLSTTFHEANIIGAEFDTIINEKGAYQRNASIRLETINYIQ